MRGRRARRADVWGAGARPPPYIWYAAAQDRQGIHGMMTVGRLERFFTDGWNRHDVDLLMTLRLIGARHFRLWMLWTRGFLRYPGLCSATTE